MSIIRTLSQGGGTKKDQEQGKLEEAYKEIDDNLDDSVSKNYNELSSTIQTFGNINSEIKVTRDRISNIRHRLVACKQQLHCRQDELRKLWDESIEQDKILKIINEIADAKKSPEIVENHIRERHFLTGVREINKTVVTLSKFDNVEALHDLNNELQSKKEAISLQVRDELTKHIYIRSCENQDSETDSELKKPEYDEHGCAIEDPSISNPETNPHVFTAVLVQACVELTGLEDLVSDLKYRMDKEIESMISRATLTISDKAHFAKNEFSNQNFVDLLEIIFKNFKYIAASQKFLIKCLKKQAKTMRAMGYEDEIGEIYNMNDVWSKITASLQRLLERYLVDEDETYEHFAVAGASANPVSNEFWKSGLENPNKIKSLFRFDHSAAAKTMNDYLRDERRLRQENNEDTGNLIEDEKKVKLLCPPSPKNITAIYKPLSDFIQWLQTTQQDKNSNEVTGPLQDFIQSHIDQTFMYQVQTELKRDMDYAVKVADPLKVVCDGHSHSSPVPLLKSSVVVEQSINELSDLAIQLGSEFRKPLLKMLCSVLNLVALVL